MQQLNCYSNKALEMMEKTLPKLCLLRSTNSYQYEAPLSSKIFSNRDQHYPKTLLLGRSPGLVVMGGDSSQEVISLKPNIGSYMDHTNLL